MPCEATKNKRLKLPKTKDCDGFIGYIFKGKNILNKN